MILLLLYLYAEWRIRALKDPSAPELDKRTGAKIEIRDRATGELRHLQVRDALDWEQADYIRWGKRAAWLAVLIVVVLASCDAAETGCNSRLAWAFATNHDGLAVDVGVAAGWGSWFGSWVSFLEVALWVVVIV